MSASKLDAVYRSILLTKFFTKGWGKPENLRRLFEFRKVVSDREQCYNLIDRDYPVTITKEQTLADCKLLEGYFMSPLERFLPGIVPEIAQKAHFQALLPLHWQDKDSKPVCLHLAGTGDHYFWRRRNLMVKPLLKEAGIGGIILENPFYGLRKPLDQVRSSLHNVSDIFVMGGCLILESLVLFHWCERHGLGPLGVTGLSMGGHMASLAATNWPKPLVLVPCLSWSTASAVFLQGVMSQSINWDLLEDQYMSDGVYREKLSKMVTIIDEAFLAGKKFARRYTQKLDTKTVVQNTEPTLQTPSAMEQSPTTAQKTTILEHNPPSPLQDSTLPNPTATTPNPTATNPNPTATNPNPTAANQNPTATSSKPTPTESTTATIVDVPPQSSDRTIGSNKNVDITYKESDNNKDESKNDELNQVPIINFNEELSKLLNESKISPRLYEKLLSNDTFVLDPEDIDDINKLSEDKLKEFLFKVKIATLKKEQIEELKKNIKTLAHRNAIEKKKGSWSLSELTADWINLSFWKSSGKKIDISKIHWRDREALQFMRGVMDECTHLSNFSVPFDTSLIIAVCAKHDAYVPRDDVGTLEEIWPGAEVRYVDAGHVSAYILHQSLFRACIKEAFERSKKKWKDGKHID